MPERTKIIRNASWLVAWDEASGSHAYRRDADLAFAGGAITAIGNVPASPQADEIDGSGFIVLPGFVDIHAHPSSEPMLKGLTDEVGSRQLYMSSLYEYLPLFENDDEGRRASNEVALCELLQSGVTTVCDLSSERDGWLDPLGGRIDKLFRRELLSWSGTGDRVAKSRAGGCKPGHAAFSVVPHLRHPCAAFHAAAAIG